jgi:acyl dehydratase
MTTTRTLSDTDFAVPVEDRYFEDYQPGAVYEYGFRTVTEAEIVEFAQRYDPQLMHVDAEWAKTGRFGGLIASGWHSAALMMRLVVDHYVSRVASLASPGADEVRWAVPLRPGDTLSLRTTIVSTRLSRSKPDRGLVVSKFELRNAAGECPMTCQAMNIIGRRP